MCGRYALSRTELLEEFFEFSFTGNQILPRFNIAPSTQIPVIRLREDGQRELIDVRWGLVPSWSRPGDQLPLLINARAETLSSKPRSAMRFNVGAASFLPVDTTSGRNFPVVQSSPFTSSVAMGSPSRLLVFGRDAKELYGTAAIVTTAASVETQPIHDRMPVILEKPDFQRWLASQSLTKQEAENLLRPSPAGSLVARPVSSRVNNVRNDDASLIDEIQSSPGLIGI